jgi:hypothetical protein
MGESTAGKKVRQKWTGTLKEFLMTNSTYQQLKIKRRDCDDIYIQIIQLKSQIKDVQQNLYFLNKKITSTAYSTSSTSAERHLHY